MEKLLLVRTETLAGFGRAIKSMLDEKAKHYGQNGGFFDTNGDGDYSHALGEASLKLKEFKKSGKRRDLIKAATWIYLILEMEAIREPEQNRIGSGIDSQRIGG